MTRDEPPGPPWVPLSDSGRGYLSVYYSDPLARWPVRELTRRGDNKSDPNIETLTYGLFSTCEPNMRNRIVADGAATIFFVTTRRRGSGRVIAGYYHVAWFTEGARGAANRDFALAADMARFVAPITVAELPDELAQMCGVKYRTCKRLDETAVVDLRRVIDAAEDRTDDYLGELQRLERFAQARSGFTYPSWGRTDGFSWADAPTYYFDPNRGAVSAPNSSKSGRWICSKCAGVITNAALLKRCPACGAIGSLHPAT